VLKVNTASGETRSFALDEPAGAEAWRVASADGEFQRSIRGAALLVAGRLHTFPRPRRFRAVVLLAEVVYDPDGQIVAERAMWRADDVVVTAVAYTREPFVTRVDVDRPGVLRFAAPARKV
jgi:hypothetical protein